MLSLFKNSLIVMMASFVSVACAQQSNLPETYSKKVLIEAKWGDGPGEFGFRIWEGDPEFPRSFVIDSKSNIYILDQLNNRIQKFVKNGKFEKYVSVESFKLADSIEIEESKTTWNNLGNIFAKTHATKLYIDAEDNLYLPVRYYSGKGQFMQKLYKYNYASVKSIEIDNNKLEQVKNVYSGLKDKSLLLQSDSTRLLKKDKYEHIYVMSLTRPQILKYDKKGNLIAVINLMGLPNQYSKYNVINSVPCIDNDGNIYQLELIPNEEPKRANYPIDATGMVLIKWEKKQ